MVPKQMGLTRRPLFPMYRYSISSHFFYLLYTLKINDYKGFLIIADLTQGEIKTHLKNLALPATIGFLFHTLYNVTDTYFAGLISTQALAALSLSFPVFFLLLSVAIGMSEALTSIVGNALGSNNKERAVIMSKNALLFALVLSLLLTLSGIFSNAFLMSLLGASGEYLLSALEYIDIVVYGALFFVLTMFINSLLNAQGDFISFRNILIFSFFLNIVLDYSFVHLGFGIQGIAYATIISEAISMFYLFYKLSQTPLWRAGFSFDSALHAKIIRLGIPPTANMLFMALGVFVVTYYASPFGEEVIAAMGVGMRIEQLAIMPIVGINVAVLALISQNNGAKNFQRIREILKIALLYTFYISLFAFALMFFLPGALISFFTTDANVIKEGILFLRVEAFIIFAFGVIFIFVALLQGIERPKFIFYISLIRQLILPFILLEILSRTTHNVLFVWIAVALSVILAAVVILFYAKKVLTSCEENYYNSSHNGAC